MAENYMQYAGGYQKDNISSLDIEKAITDFKSMDDKHGAFWISVIKDDKNVMEVNKDLSLSVIFEGEETKHQASSWKEVERLYELLLG